MNKEQKSPVYGHDVIEFTTVALQYCAFVENAAEKERTEFVDTLLKLLPLLYLKRILFQKFDLLNEDESENSFQYVTIENYEIVRNNIAFVLRDMDDYLDVFVEEMKYSDAPILMTISENLADIYQDLKNYICAYKDGTEEIKMRALADCKKNFEQYWGQKLTNVMRALHEVRYGNNHCEDEIFEY